MTSQPALHIYIYQYKHHNVNAEIAMEWYKILTKIRKFACTKQPQCNMHLQFWRSSKVVRFNGSLSAAKYGNFISFVQNLRFVLVLRLRVWPLFVAGSRAALDTERYWTSGLLSSNTLHSRFVFKKPFLRSLSARSDLNGRKPLNGVDWSALLKLISQACKL